MLLKYLGVILVMVAIASAIPAGEDQFEGSGEGETGDYHRPMVPGPVAGVVSEIMSHHGGRRTGMSVIKVLAAFIMGITSAAVTRRTCPAQSMVVTSAAATRRTCPARPATAAIWRHRRLVMHTSQKITAAWSATVAYCSMRPWDSYIVS